FAAAGVCDLRQSLEGHGRRRRAGKFADDARHGWRQQLAHAAGAHAEGDDQAVTRVAAANRGAPCWSRGALTPQNAFATRNSRGEGTPAPSTALRVLLNHPHFFHCLPAPFTVAPA